MNVIITLKGYKEFTMDEISDVIQSLNVQVNGIDYIHAVFFGIIEFKTSENSTITSDHPSILSIQTFNLKRELEL